jgi:hypothetical protein
MLEERSMVEDEDSRVIILHPEVVGKIIRPQDLDPTDSLHVQGVERLLKFDTVISSSWTSREIIVHEFAKISLFPFESSSPRAFWCDIADPYHKEKTSDEID